MLSTSNLTYNDSSRFFNALTWLQSQVKSRNRLNSEVSSSDDSDGGRRNSNSPRYVRVFFALGGWFRNSKKSKKSMNLKLMLGIVLPTAGVGPFRQLTAHQNTSPQILFVLSCPLRFHMLWKWFAWPFTYTHAHFHYPSPFHATSSDRWDSFLWSPLQIATKSKDFDESIVEIGTIFTRIQIAASHAKSMLTMFRSHVF